MTSPQSEDAAAKSEQPEGESTAVRVEADAASEQDTVEEAGEVESKVADSGESDAAGTPKVSAVKRAKPKVRLRLPWTREESEPEPTPAAPSPVEPQDHSADEGGGGEHEPKPPAGGEAASSSSVEKPDDADTKDEESVDGGADDTTDATDSAALEATAKEKRQIDWPRVVAFGVLPGLALVSAGAAGFFKWEDSSARAVKTARIESVAAAKDNTIALLTYKSESVEKDLETAKGRLTGGFKDSYSQLINDVVIPGAKKAHVSTTATVPAQASVSATPSHAVVLLFVNQTATVDKEPPADTESSVRVTLDKVDGRWLISGFEPV